MKWFYKAFFLVYDRLCTKVGVVESIDLTFGGAGNQNMKINGTTYATWIDYKSWPKIGSKVRHKPYREPDGRGNMMLATKIIEYL